MRIPFPERISLTGTVLFALFLCTMQQLQGTDPIFSMCCFLFIIVATLAFNLAGGFTRPSGSYVFFYAVLGVIVGICWKAILGERADSNLRSPLLTIQVFRGGICSMWLAVFISRRLTTKKPLLGNFVTDENMQNATIGLLVIGLTISVLLIVFPTGSGSVLSALTQINRFLPLAVILGTVHTIRKSGGTRSISLPVIIAGFFVFAIGVLSFSKEGMFTPFVCWLFAAGSQRYKLTNYQVIGAVVFVIVMFVYLVPYSQYGKGVNREDVTFAGQLALASRLLDDIDNVRDQSNQETEDAYQSNVQHYFNSSQGFFDRLQMLSVDDVLLDDTEQEGPFGYSPIILGFQNLVPRVFFPNKPSINFGNLYAHQLGGLDDDDYTTGISFSPSGEAYHIDKWVGVLILEPALLILLFTLFDSLCGDVRKSPWGLLMIAYFSHIAPEGMLGSVIYALGFLSFSLVIAAISAAYIAPIVGSLVAGPENRGLRRGRLIASIPGRKTT